VRVLGVCFDSCGVSPRTWETINSALERQVAVAEKFALSLRYRAYLVKAVSCGQRFYAAHVGLPPPRFCRRVTTCLFRFYWSHGTELVTRAVLRLSTSLGGRRMPCVDTMSRVLALRTILGVLDDTEHPARCLALYFLGPSRRRLVPRALGNRYPSAEITPPFYQTVVSFQEDLRRVVQDLMVRDEPPARIVEEVCLTQITADERVGANAFSWDSLVSRCLPEPVEDLEWRQGWEVLPTRDRLQLWGMVPDSRCPNCGEVET
ncbi:unnamed protein product, partial [Ixodes pacificus]